MRLEAWDGAQLAAGAGENSRRPPATVHQRGGDSGRGAREARYVHTPLATSSCRVFRGTTKEGEFIERKSKRKRLLADLVMSLNKCGRDGMARGLATCGLYFSVGRREGCGGHVLKPQPCNSIFCAACSVRRSRPLQGRILKCCHRRGKRYWFLTLTVPNVTHLTREALDDLTGAFQRLRDSEVWKHVKFVAGEWQGVTGGVYSLECIRSKYGESWHPHLHVLIELPKDHPTEWLEALKKTWLRVSGGGEYLHLMRVYGTSKSGKRSYRRVNRKALKELVKYVTKAAPFARSPELIDEFVSAFENVRRVQAFGSFYGELGDEEREPGDDGEEVKCSCGMYHYHSEFCWQKKPVRAGDTKLMPDGTRQLKFDFWSETAGSVDESPPWQLEREHFKGDGQIGIEFPGVLPGKAEPHPSLFADVA